MLGVPAEMYRYGIQYWACSISGLIVTIFMVYVFLPVFYELQTTSCYAYLEQRFDKRVRRLASFLFMLYCLLNVPVLIYTPAIAFSQGKFLTISLLFRWIRLFECSINCSYWNRLTYHHACHLLYLHFLHHLWRNTVWVDSFCENYE